MDPFARLLGGRPSPEIEAETRGLARVLPIEEIATARTPFSWGRSPDTAIERETRGLTWTGGHVGGLGAPPGSSMRGREWWRRIGNTIIDWHCTRANALIGGAVVSIWLGPAGGAAATQATTAVQDMVCPQINAARSLMRQLRDEGINITRDDAWYLIKNREYIYDDKKGIWRRTGPMVLLGMAVRPYLPYVAVAGLALAVLVAVKE